MFARKNLSSDFEAWNKKWGAPFGRSNRSTPGIINLIKKRDEFDSRGIFGFQGNNDTRAFEYPWAYFNGHLRDDMNILEIGGGMSGFQFAVAKSGANVTNVDPGMDNIGGRVSQDFFSRANKKLSTNVTLLEKTIADAELEPNTFDVAYSISVIEHIPAEEIQKSMSRIAHLLKPGGKFIITVDLFLDLVPFSRKTTNRFGSNISIKHLVETSGLQLEFGDKSELYGFEEFDPERVMELLPDLFIGTGYPTLVQCAVLTRPL